MYSGRLVYQPSFSVTSGESSGSMAKPLRMRCHRSGSGIGTSSMSSKAGGKAAAAGGVSAAMAAAGPSASTRASPPTLQRVVMRLVLVLQETFRMLRTYRRGVKDEKKPPD